MRRAPTTTALGILAGLIACGSEPETQGQSMAIRPEASLAKASGSDATNEAPIIERVRITPSDPSPGDQVVALAEASDADGDRIEFVYQWHVDGRRQDSETDTLHVESARKGSRIELTVVARDGRDQSAAERATARVGNSAPVLQGIVIEPLGQVTAFQDVTASPEASDPDGDELEFEYAWSVNGSDVGVDGPVLPSAEFERGDEITVVVSATDGEDSSDSIESQSIRVVNARPKITSVPGAIGEDGVFRYQVDAEDPDGDSLFRYRLTESPDGMQLDIVHGQLTWEPASSQEGVHNVAIQIDDRSGGIASQSFTIEVGFGEPVPASAE